MSAQGTPSERIALGPVSARLEAELREQVRKQGLVFFLDREGHYTGLIDTLKSNAEAGNWPYPIRAYRQSILELLLALGDDENGVDRSPLLVHLPGFIEDDVKASPLYELYAAGTRHRRALETLITEAAAGRVRPEEIEAFKASGPHTLAEADAWLQAAVNDSDDGLQNHLRHSALTAIVDDLLTGGTIAQRLTIAMRSKPAGGEGSDDSAAQVVAHFGRVAGLPERWGRDVKRERPRDLAFLVSSWCLAVEYTTDLQRPPRDDRLKAVATLPESVQQTCRVMAGWLRDHHVGHYERFANETESWLLDETDVVVAEDLGSVDTFVFEEAAILTAALTALEEGAWKKALAWAVPRAEGASFWTKRSPARLTAWRLVRDLAVVGDAIANAPAPSTDRDLDQLTDDYVARGAPVDRAHRHLEQRRLMLTPQIPAFERLRHQLEVMRGAHRQWADGWARAWNQVCVRRGFLPSADRQQRTLFDAVVKPLASDRDGGVTAIFVVDALRFEMAQELAQAIDDGGGLQRQLSARLAELPSVTEIGMNVLAPVCLDGKLRPEVRDGAFKGFAAGEFRVHDPETRRRAMFDRVGGRGCPLLSLEEVLRLDATSLKKRVEQARLMVVHSQEIDTAGENGVGTHVYDRVLQDLRAAWRLLRDAGVRRFVMTSDHGFLLLEDRHGEAQPHGRRVDPKRRYAFSTQAADHAGEVRVSLADLGYVDAAGAPSPGHLVFPETTTVFDTTKRGQRFVHGGNSPQERIIPVLTLVHRHAAGADTHHYEIESEPAEGGDGLSACQARVVVRDALFGGKATIELGLRALNAPANVVVELVQVQGPGARLADTVMHVPIGKPWTVLFRLRGSSDAKLAVELYHTGREASVSPSSPDRLYPVFPLPTATVAPAPTPATASTLPAASTTSMTSMTSTAPAATLATSATSAAADEWAERLPAGGFRQALVHVSVHGSLTEPELVGMVGNQREARRFARELERLVELVPFRVRIDIVGGIKRYVRDGNDA